MTLTHIILTKTILLLAIPVGFFLTAFLAALLDYGYGRLFLSRSPKPAETHPFLQNLR